MVTAHLGGLGQHLLLEAQPREQLDGVRLKGGGVQLLQALIDVLQGIGHGMP